MIKYILSCVCLLIAHCVLSQTTHTIRTDGSGKLKSTMPARIDNTDTVRFYVYEPEETMSIYTKQLQNKVINSKKILMKIRNTEKEDLLADVYGISPGDLDSLNSEMDKVLANPFHPDTLGYIPVFRIGVDDKYYSLQHYYTASPGTIQFGPNEFSRAVPAGMATGEKRMDFLLSKTDPFKNLLVIWLNKTKDNFKPLPDLSELPALKKELQDNIPVIKIFLTNRKPWFENKVDSFVTGDIPQLKVVTAEAIKLLNGISPLLGKIGPTIDISANKEWVLQWFWYQANELPALNPFSFQPDDSFGDPPSTAKLEGIKRKIKVREDALARAKPGALTVKDFDTITDEIDALKKEAEEIENMITRYKSRVLKNQKTIEAFSTTKQELNRAILYIGSLTNEIYWMRHHSASDNYSLLNDEDRGNYLEEDRVLLLAHNLKPGQRTQLHITFENISNDRSLLADQFEQLRKGLDPIIGKIAPVAAVAGSDDPVDVAVTKAHEAIAELEFALETAGRYSRAIDYLLAQSNAFTDITVATDKSLAYHSEVTNSVRRIEGPTRVAYSMDTTKAPLPLPTPYPSIEEPRTNYTDTFRYRVNKLYRLFPMAGIGYTFTKFNSLIHENGQDKIVTDTRAHFFIGLKVFLRKTDIRSSKFITGTDDRGRRLILSRTSINVGFDVAKPLNNIYTGIGLDLWPGFCINAGSVFNKYTYNVYSNDQLIQTRTSYRPGFYLGVATDVSLFMDLAKILNLTK